MVLLFVVVVWCGWEEMDYVRFGFFVDCWNYFYFVLFLLLLLFFLLSLLRL